MGSHRGVNKPNKGRPMTIWIAFLFSHLPPSPWTRDVLYRGETDGSIKLLQQSITEGPYKSSGALSKWRCDYTGKKLCLCRLSAGLFPAEGFQLWAIWTTAIARVQSGSTIATHCPPIAPSTTLHPLSLSHFLSHSFRRESVTLSEWWLIGFNSTCSSKTHLVVVRHGTDNDPFWAIRCILWDPGIAWWQFPPTPTHSFSSFSSSPLFSS